MVLAIGAVAGIVVRQVGKGRECVGEVKLVDGRHHIVVWLCEDKLVGITAVDKDAVDARCAEVARGVVFATHTCCKDGVGVHVRHRVDGGGTLVAKAAVYGPNLYTTWNLLVGAKRVGRYFARHTLSVVVVGRLSELVELVVVIKLCRHTCRYKYGGNKSE